MTLPMTAAEVLEREFLEMRAKLLELAASLDRMDRSDGEVVNDRRLELIREGIQVLSSRHDDRAEQLQLLFSREYDDQWQERFFDGK